MTTAQAREVVRANLGVYRAAFVEAPGTPLLDHPQARVRLHTRVSAAHDELRARKAHLEQEGYAVTFGTLGKGLLILSKDQETRAICIDKRKR